MMRMGIAGSSIRSGLLSVHTVTATGTEGNAEEMLYKSQAQDEMLRWNKNKDAGMGWEERRRGGKGKEKGTCGICCFDVRSEEEREMRWVSES